MVLKYHWILLRNVMSSNYIERLQLVGYINFGSPKILKLK